MIKIASLFFILVLLVFFGTGCFFLDRFFGITKQKIPVYNNVVVPNIPVIPANPDIIFTTNDKSVYKLTYDGKNLGIVTGISTSFAKIINDKTKFFYKDSGTNILNVIKTDGTEKSALSASTVTDARFNIDENGTKAIFITAGKVIIKTVVGAENSYNAPLAQVVDLSSDGLHFFHMNGQNSYYDNILRCTQSGMKNSTLHPDGSFFVTEYQKTIKKYQTGPGIPFVATLSAVENPPKTYPLYFARWN